MTIAPNVVSGFIRTSPAGPRQSPAWCPAKEVGAHEQINDVPAFSGLDAPQSSRLSLGELQARHFVEFATNAIHEAVKIRDGRGLTTLSLLIPLSIFNSEPAVPVLSFATDRAAKR